MIMFKFFRSNIYTIYMFSLSIPNILDVSRNHLIFKKRFVKPSTKSKLINYDGLETHYRETFKP
jgi:hypothetical protein